MRPRGISQIVRVGMLSAAVLVVVSGAGLHVGNGVVEAQTAGAAEAAADAAETARRHCRRWISRS